MVQPLGISAFGEYFYVLAPPAPFRINKSLAGAWFNFATRGQGFFIDVYENSNQMFLAWFTFDLTRPDPGVPSGIGEPGHRWLTAQGPYDGDSANLTIYVTEGGVFDAAEPPVTRDPAGDGTMTIEFADCTEGLVNYQITSLGISGEIPLNASCRIMCLCARRWPIPDNLSAISPFDPKRHFAV